MITKIAKFFLALEDGIKAPFTVRGRVAIKSFIRRAMEPEIVFFWLAPTIFVVWLASAYIMAWIYPEPMDNRGIAGDQFGAVNALFSGLAFAGLITTLLLQRKELELQREELRMTRAEHREAKEQLKA